MNFPHQRVLIYGVTGSGKTTLAKRLSHLTGLPWHSVDDLTWKPSWVTVPAEEQRTKIELICSEDRWILDTAYGTWIDVPLERAELVVALDYPSWISFGRLLRRTAARVINGQLVCNGNRESLRTVFSKDSILIWHFRSFRRKRERISVWSNGARSFEIVRIRSAQDLEVWIEKI